MKKLYKSKSCGTIVGKVFDDGGVLACCGEDMEELVPKTADSATEKHVPVLSVTVISLRLLLVAHFTL